MKKLYPIIILGLLTSCKQFNFQEDYDFTTIFEDSNGTKTATYQEVIDFYKNLADAYPNIDIKEIGNTDAGKPLHLITLNQDGEFDFNRIHPDKSVLLINNGIHPGEPDGIDATMMLFRDIAEGKIDSLKNTVLVTIPIYNVGGSLNRNSTSRTNQNGPEAYGFRGNARNYDLNRDFIKNDTKNAKSFAQIFHLVQPDVFIDNHVSNGADYQYTLTHLFTQHNKLGGILGLHLHNEMMPKLEQKLAEKEWDITPYVNVFNQGPEKGFSQFMDYPRYSTGYVALWNTLGMMVETHMLKPYKQRVNGTYELMKSMIEITEEDHLTIASLRQKALNKYKVGSSYPLDWKVDTTQTSTLQFKGYEGEFIESEITGAKRLKYNGDKPFTKEVVYQNYFVPKVETTIPTAYVIPQGWHDVLDLLDLNQVEMLPFKNDTTLTVTSYKIHDFNTVKTPFEGHYMHSNTQVVSESKKVNFRAGDYYIDTQQPALRYLMETLEPQAPDSFFNWNFFDTILQQKEHFSPYVWEDKAQELLENRPDIKEEFNRKKETDTTFSSNWYAQLDWLHKQSEHYETAHLQYPVYRVE